VSEQNELIEKTCAAEGYEMQVRSAETAEAEEHRFVGTTNAKTQPAEVLLFNSSAAPREVASCLLIASPIPLPPALVDWQGLKSVLFK
jgi:hypothetical protein